LRSENIIFEILSDQEQLIQIAENYFILNMHNLLKILGS